MPKSQHWHLLDAALDESLLCTLSNIWHHLHLPLILETWHHWDYYASVARLPHTLKEGVDMLPRLVLVDEEPVDGLEVVVHPLQVVLSLLDGLLHLPLARPQGVLVLVAELNQLKSSKKATRKSPVFNYSITKSSPDRRRTWCFGSPRHSWWAPESRRSFRRS